MQIIFAWPAGSPLARMASWGSLLVVGSALLGVLFLWAKHEILDPLAELNEQATRASRGHPPKWTREIPVELAPAAKAVDSLFQSMIGERHRAEHIELTINRRVKSRVRRLNANLRHANKQTSQDPLTQLDNRRSIDDRLDHLLEMARQDKQDLACVYIDMDHFKPINDTLGHGVGDEVLVCLASLLRNTVRDGDIAARLGGDEFCLILPGASAEQAAKVVERAAKLFRQYAQTYRGKLDVLPDISSGVASLRANAPADGAELLELADTALYQAKHSGKCGVLEPVAG